MKMMRIKRVLCCFTVETPRRDVFTNCIGKINDRVTNE
jgi:hypothetical protein